MNHCIASLSAPAGALITSLAMAVALATSARAEEVIPPQVPSSLTVPSGNVPYLVGHAVGTQNYACVPTDTGIKWMLYTPQATLFDDFGEQMTTHFFSPNPLAPSEFLPTWQDSTDTSAVWVKAVAAPYTGGDFVEPNAIAWLLLKVVTSVAGPTGGETLTATTYIQRLHTTGGSAPAKGCSKPLDLGKKVIVPYTADYYFYRPDIIE